MSAAQEPDQRGSAFESEHSLRPEFRSQLEGIQVGISRLSAGVGELIPRATQILLDGDLEGADYVILGDVEYDRKSAELEDECFHAFALQAPVATDLRSVVAAIKIIADVERSADLCVNICKAARRLHGHPLDAKLRGIIQKMGDQAHRMFKQATEAYLNFDGPAAAALRDMDSYLDELHRQFIQVIFECHAAGTIDLQPAVQLAVVARFYERIGDHAVLVGDRTRFIVSGWVPDHPYPESGNDLSPDAGAPKD
jgi:phosphate transport system protein